MIANCCELLREGHHDKSPASTKQSATRSSATRLSFSCCTDRCALCRVCRSVFQTLGHLFSAPEWLQCTCARQGCSQYNRVLFSLHSVSLLSLHHHSRSIFVFFHSSLIQLELSVFTPTWSCSLLELSHRYILPPNPYFSIPLLIRHNEVFPLRPRSGSCSCSVCGSNHQLLRRFQPGCVSLSLPAESGCG